MEKRFYFIISALLSVLFLSGCAMFGSGGNLQEKGFYGRIAPSESSSPLPVEIAKDIESISEEGVLYIRESDIVAKVEDAIVDKSVESSSRPVAGQDTATLPKSRPKEKVGFLDKNRRGPLLGSRGKRRFKKGPLSWSTKSSLPPLKGGKTVSYIVRWGDTLMKIAFEKYGNYLRWKDIYKVNKDKMENPRKMQVGTELTIKNVKYVYIKKDGRPYLIKKKDTLKSISQKLYGTPDRWQEIWKNNPQLIQNPKKIYAGFTLYYQPKKVSPDILRVPAQKDRVSKKK